MLFSLRSVLLILALMFWRQPTASFAQTDTPKVTRQTIAQLRAKLTSGKPCDLNAIAAVTSQMLQTKTEVKQYLLMIGTASEPLDSSIPYIRPIHILDLLGGLLDYGDNAARKGNWPEAKKAFGMVVDICIRLSRIPIPPKEAGFTSPQEPGLEGVLCVLGPIGTMQVTLSKRLSATPFPSKTGQQRVMAVLDQMRAVIVKTSTVKKRKQLDFFVAKDRTAILKLDMQALSTEKKLLPKLRAELSRL
jgi:hypothetical protein